VRSLVIGVGSAQGDDAVGLEIAARLRRGPLPGGVKVVASERPSFALLDGLEGIEALVIVDAVRATGHAGRWRWIPRAELASVERPTSTHGLGVAEGLALAEALDLLPPEVVILGVEAERFAGDSLSAPVARAVEPACAMLLEYLVRLRTAPRKRLAPRPSTEPATAENMTDA
jgi:hydrogenase maturation protease